jgi:hypothetical protein
MMIRTIPQSTMAARRLLSMAATLAASSSLSTVAAAAAGSGNSNPRLHLVSWNVAAVNNNPFEYYVTYPDPAYTTLMGKVEAFVQTPDLNRDDIEVSKVFPFYDDLETLMLASGQVSPSVAKHVRSVWETDLQHKRIVSGFLKDAALGKKRFASMPDRLTNTISSQGEATLYRPTAINCYAGRFANMEEWWKQWQTFMFHTATKKQPAIVNMLKPIPRAKYPALSEVEETNSVGLQIVYQAVFDAIMVHMLNQVAGSSAWQEIRAKLAKALNLNKSNRVWEILQTTYRDADVLFLQEVAGSFAMEWARNQAKYEVVMPQSAKDRDQNSIVLLDRLVFTKAKEITSELDLTGVAVDDGDLLVVKAQHLESGRWFILASFHGDTDGLVTIPVLKAVHALVRKTSSEQEETILLFGMDANAYMDGQANKQLGVSEFEAALRDMHMVSCFSGVSANKHLTTFNARTFLQPQLNKAVGKDEMRAKGDINPKDYVVGYASQVAFTGVGRDNTGAKKYVEDMVFPTLEFPSDHGVVFTDVEVVAGKGGAKAEL